MKKILMLGGCLLVLTGCSLGTGMLNTPKKQVESFFSKYQTLDQSVLDDLDKVVACCGIKCENCSLSKPYLKLLNKRNINNIEDFNDTIFVGENSIHKSILFSPIIVEGDILGSIVVLYNNYNEQILSNLKLATNFISKLTY